MQPISSPPLLKACYVGGRLMGLTSSVALTYTRLIRFEQIMGKISEWLKSWGTLIGLGLTILTFAYFLGGLNEAVEGVRKEQGEQNVGVQAVRNEMSSTTAAIAGMRSELSGLTTNTQAIPALQRRIDAVQAKLNDEIIPRLNVLDKNSTAPIQPAQVAAILNNQEKTLDGLSELGTKTDLVSQRASEIANDQWRIGDHILSPIVQEAAADALSPIHGEWQRAVQAQRQTGAPTTGSAYIPGGVTLSTEPKVQTRVQGGVVTIEGVVPNEAAKRSIVTAIEGVNPKQIMSDDLRIRP